MKKMKFVLMSICIVVSLSAQCQHQEGFFIGPQATTAHYLCNDIKQDTKQKYGFQAGYGLILPVEPGISFAPSLFYSMKGYKVTFNQFLFPPDSLATDNDTRIHCVELAALLQFDLGKEAAHWFGRFGPSFDIQLFGHEQYNRMVGGMVSQKMRYSFGDYGHYSFNVLFN